MQFLNWVFVSLDQAFDFEEESLGFLCLSRSCLDPLCCSYIRRVLEDFGFGCVRSFEVLSGLFFYLGNLVWYVLTGKAFGRFINDLEDGDSNAALFGHAS